MCNFLGINLPYDINVHTTKGIKCVRHLTPGDKLYEYGTSNLLEVQEVLKSDIQTIWQVVYNDGRLTYGIGSTPVLYGDKIISLKEAARRGNYPPIKTFAIDYHRDDVIAPLFPDPYTAGALLVHGDYDDEFINLPINGICEPNNFIRFMHKSNTAQVTGKDKIYFSWAHRSEEERITWKEFFPRYEMYVTSKDGAAPLIPKEYLESSIRDRRKFIRGVFDVGYSKDITPDVVATMNSTSMLLTDVQKILWSLGVLSKIVANPMIPLSRWRNFRLEILGEYTNYPGFFYSIGNINKILDNDNRINPKGSAFKLKISKILKFNQGYTYEVRLNKPHAIYTSANFLPIVSL